MIGNANRKSGPESCSHCRKPIPAGAEFCPHCGTPSLPGEEPDKGMGFGQTFIRIFLIVALFGAIVVFKLDLNLRDDVQELSPSGPAMKSSDAEKTVKPHVVDFKTSHHIKVAQSKVRRNPSKKSNVLMVLKKGAKVSILDGNEDWWKITGDGKTGWIAKEDLDTEIQ